MLKKINFRISKIKIMKIVIPPIFDSKSKYNFLPSYIFQNITLNVGAFNYFVVRLFLGILKILVKIRLQAITIASHAQYKRFLPQEVVDNVYTREAENYEWKHHRTTNFRDTWWRRIAAFYILNLARERSLNKIKILDLGTGIGLSLEEAFKIFKDTSLEVEAVGLDYNTSMLEQATKVTLPRMARNGLLENNKKEILFVRGDARNLRGIEEKKNGFSYFNNGEFDFITLVCGAGGIHLPLEAFIEQLNVLKDGGYLIVIDIHRPLFHLNEHWPRLLRFFDTNLFQYLGWKEITMPLVLRDLWGWLDPTPLFYLLPLTTDIKNSTGFAINYFEVISEKWWFNLPVITTGRLILKKKKYSQDELFNRVKVQNELFNSLK